MTVDLRVVTINTWKGDGPYRARMRALAELLAAERPDVVCLQESLRAEDGSLDTARDLASALRMSSAMTATRRKVRSVEGVPVISYSGPATLSRWPIARSCEVDLPREVADDERVALITGIASPAGPMQVINVHLSHVESAPGSRLRQLQGLFQADVMSDRAVLHLLCGDFNSRPDSEVIRWLLRSLEDWNVTDVCAGQDAPTLSSRNPFVGRAGVEARIDYVFAITKSPGEAPRVLRAGTVLDSPSSDGVFASDHFGVGATLESPSPVERLDGWMAGAVSLT